MTTKRKGRVSTPRPSGSSYAELVVHADAIGAKVSLNRGLVDGETWLEIEETETIRPDAGGRARLELRSPGALKALVSALLQLLEDPEGQKLLAARRSR